MNAALAIAGDMGQARHRVAPEVSLPDHVPANNNALLATASTLFAGLVPDPSARDAAVQALIALVAQAVSAPAPAVEPWIGQEEAARRIGTDRQTLDGMLHRAPGLPGGPVDVGLGKRHQYRWDPTRLGEWAAAYQAEKAEKAVAKTKPDRSRKAKTSSKPVKSGVVNWNEVGRGEVPE